MTSNITSFGIKRKNTMDFFKAQEESHKANSQIHSYVLRVSELLCEATSVFPSLNPRDPWRTERVLM
jgi:hypothetical protein